VPLQPVPLVSPENSVANLEPRMAEMTVQMNAVQARETAIVAELTALQAAAAFRGAEGTTSSCSTSTWRAWC